MRLSERMHRLLGAALLLACAVLAPAQARTVLDLDTTGQPVALEDWGDAWLDATGRLGPDEVAGDRTLAWAPTRPDAIYPLRHGQALWVRFTIPPAPDAERWYLQIPYASVNRVTLYTQDSIGRWLPQSAGDHIPVSRWPVPHRHPLLPLAITAEEPRHYLLRVENGHSFSAPLSFVSESHLSRKEQRTSLVLGIYFGLAGLAATLAALSAGSLRDAAYALYAVSVALMGLTQASITGIAGLHLWPELAAWNDLSSLILPVLACGAGLWFVAAMVSLAERSRRLYLAVLVLGAASLPAAAAIALVDPSSRLALMVPYIVLASCAMPLVTIWAARRGDPWAGWLLATSLPVLAGAAFPLARTAGLIPVSFWTQHGMQLGIAIELPLVLLLLLLRSQHRREHSRRVRGVDRIDPGTGLINGAVFGERMVRLIARSQRLKMRSAVLLVEISNIEQIRRRFDRRSAEELPLCVAGRLMSAAREIDSVARLSDSRFGMLLEGPLTAEDVAAAGPRVVARCLMPFKNKPLDWVAQVRVAQALVPMDGTDAELLLAQLEDLLDAVPADSRRAVFQLGRGSEATRPVRLAATAS